ncbi:MAG: peptidoglycan-binding domain-containing protein [Candidatus Omnitrophota bacterium]|nr:peptidoglycan-binding protein [Candidatus Omnitrophota bacterium]
MKKLCIVFLGLILLVSFNGCGRKQEALDQMQQPMSPEDLSRIKTESQVAQEMKPETLPQAMLQGQAASMQKPEVKLDPLPPSGPYKPSSIEIQEALKNAGYYMGKVDGKIGPISKKAIEDFQKANGLIVDGKVGPKTWGVLGKYLKERPSQQSGR